MTEKQRPKRRLDGAVEAIQLWKIVGFHYEDMNIVVECPKTNDRLMISLISTVENDCSPSDYKDPPISEMKLGKSEDDKESYINTIRAEKCYCGRAKNFGFILCFGCNQDLDSSTKVQLYKAIGGNFKEAYKDACKYLNMERREL